MISLVNEYPFCESNYFLWPLNRDNLKERGNKRTLFVVTVRLFTSKGIIFVLNVQSVYSFLLFNSVWVWLGKPKKTVFF